MCIEVIVPLLKQARRDRCWSGRGRDAFHLVSGHIAPVLAGLRRVFWLCRAPPDFCLVWALQHHPPGKTKKTTSLAECGFLAPVG